MAAEINLLRQAGHQVTLFTRDNQEIDHYSFSQTLQLPLKTIWNAASYHDVRQKLQMEQSQLLHVQNFFPLFSPAVHGAARSLDIPTIQHLRNFRLGCLNPWLRRQNTICRDCVGKNPWRGVMYRCYRQSLPASLALWGMVTWHRWSRTWHYLVDGFIAPSRFAAELLSQMGIPGDRLYVKPNTTADPFAGHPPSPLPPSPRFLFIGRLSAEKGLDILLRAWAELPVSDWALEILGDGPDRDRLQHYVQEQQLQGVTFHGHQPQPILRHWMEQATAVIIPSQGYETFGRTVIEAYAHGRSVLASDLGALPELMIEGETGFLVEPANIFAWKERILWAGEHLTDMETMGRRSRQVYLQHYRPEVNYQQLIEIYGRVLGSA